MTTDNNFPASPLPNPPSWVIHPTRMITKEMQKSIITPVLTEIAKQRKITITDLKTGKLRAHKHARKIACYILYCYGFSHKNVAEVMGYSLHTMSSQTVAGVKLILQATEPDGFSIKETTLSVLNHFNLQPL